MLVKSHKEIFGKDFPMNGEWDAGITPFGVSPAGRWTVCREHDCFSVFFYDFSTGVSSNADDNKHTETILETFPPTEDGEIAAKEYALSLVNQAWNSRK